MHDHVTSTHSNGFIREVRVGPMRDAVMNRTWQTSTAGQLAQAEFPYQRMHREPIHIGPPNMGAADRTPPPATPMSTHTNSGEREGGVRARSCFFHVVR